MASPRFSIIIPTRNRAHTLRFTLQTCLAQQFGDFEVIVSDNQSGPQTRAVVEACGDPRVRYVRTPAPLAMTDSYDFAVGHATGEVVSVLGDDDGLLLHALSEADRLFSMTGARALQAPSVLYFWPDVLTTRDSRPNELVLPLGMRHTHNVVFPYQSANRIRAAANGDLSYADLPMIYRGFIHRDVLTSLKQRSGRLFGGVAPDVFSAFAIAHALGSYHSVEAPLFISGASGHSTGIATLATRAPSAVADDFHQLNARAGITWRPVVPELMLMPTVIAICFLYARERFFPDDAFLVLDRKRLIVNCLRAIDTCEHWAEALAACRRSLADDPALLSWFEQEHAGRAFEAPPTPAAPPRRYGETYLRLDAAEFGVSDVAGAAELCERVLGYQRDRLNVKVLDKPPEEETPLSVLEEKERVIRGLDLMVQDRDQIIARLKQSVHELEAWRARWRRPLRRGLPHLLRKVVRKLVSRGEHKPAA